MYSKALRSTCTSIVVFEVLRGIADVEVSVIGQSQPAPLFFKLLSVMQWGSLAVYRYEYVREPGLDNVFYKWPT
jgi:hypothetical protein